MQPSAERASQLGSALRSARRIPLGGLARAEVAELLADQLGKDVSAEVLDEVVSATECNPFAGDSGELLDARARASYEARLREAREELELARRHNDRGQRERLVDEIELLGAELSRGYGLGGRARRAGAASERARVAVTARSSTRSTSWPSTTPRWPSTCGTGFEPAPSACTRRRVSTP
ncbi:MAG: hypothetical protein WEF50_07550 [Myxococcota bacterium]